MTSVAKTFRDIQFDPTNFNKLYNKGTLLNRPAKTFSQENPINYSQILNTSVRPFSINSSEKYNKIINTADESNDYLDQTSEYDIYSVRRNYKWEKNKNIQQIPIHKKPLDVIILDIIQFLFDFIDISNNNKKNIINYIFSNSNNQFLFSIVLIITGIVILFFSGLLH